MKTTCIVALTAIATLGTLAASGARGPVTFIAGAETSAAFAQGPRRNQRLQGARLAA